MTEIETERLPHRWVGGGDPAGEINSGDRARERTQRVAGDARRGHANAAQDRALSIGADRKNPEAEGAPVKQERHRGDRCHAPEEGRGKTPRRST